MLLLIFYISQVNFVFLLFLGMVILLMKLKTKNYSEIKKITTTYTGTAIGTLQEAITQDIA